MDSGVQLPESRAPPQASLSANPPEYLWLPLCCGHALTRQGGGWAEGRHWREKGRKKPDFQGDAL